MPGDRGIQAYLGLIEAKAVLAKFEIFFYRPAQPGGADQPGHARALAFRHEAVVKGQLTGARVAADRQVMPRAGGAQQRPGIPALAFGAGPGGADLPAAGIVQQPGDRLRAGQPGPSRQRQAKAGRNPQHIALASLFAELAQFGAGAVDLVAADEVQPDAGECLGEDVDGKLARPQPAGACTDSASI